MTKKTMNNSGHESLQDLCSFSSAEKQYNNMGQVCNIQTIQVCDSKAVNNSAGWNLHKSGNLDMIEKQFARTLDSVCKIHTIQVW